MKQENDQPDIAEDMARFAENAVALAEKKFQEELDYSEDSLMKLESILGTLSQDIPRGWLARLLGRGPSRQQIEAICLMFGAYLGEVVRRKWGGTWCMDSTLGTEMPSVAVFDGNIYPIGKVYKRLTNGEEDNVWGFYRMMVEIAQKGDIGPDMGGSVRVERL